MAFTNARIPQDILMEYDLKALVNLTLQNFWLKTI